MRLTLLGARYYDELVGRFISVDPIMDLTDPQQWRGYAYANNNPVTWTDPTGLKPHAAHDGTPGGFFNELRAIFDAFQWRIKELASGQASRESPPRKGPQARPSTLVAAEGEVQSNNSKGHAAQWAGRVAEVASDVSIVAGFASGATYTVAAVATPINPAVATGLATAANWLGWLSTGASVAQLIGGIIANDDVHIRQGVLGSTLGFASAATWGPAAKLIVTDAPRVSRALSAGQALLRTSIGYLQGAVDSMPGTGISGPWIERSDMREQFPVRRRAHDFLDGLYEQLQ